MHAWIDQLLSRFLKCPGNIGETPLVKLENYNPVQNIWKKIEKSNGRSSNGNIEINT